MFEGIKNIFTRKAPVENKPKTTYSRRQRKAFTQMKNDIQDFQKGLTQRSLGLREEVDGRLDYAGTPIFGSINRAIRAGHYRLTHITKGIACNSPFGKRYVQMCKDNVIGSGINPKIALTNSKGKVDTVKSKAIEKAFWMWAENPDLFALNGQFDLYEFLNQMESDRITKGEAFAIIGYSTDGHMNLRLVPAERLDVTLDQRIDANTIIKAGIEYDEETMRPLAYWFDTYDQLTDTDQKQTVRYPADEVIHYYEAWFSEQLRGISDFVPVIKQINQLDAYIDTSIIAARVAASSMAFITQEKDADDTMMDEEEQSAEQEPIVTEWAAGEISMLNPGMDVKTVTTNQTSEQYDQWIQGTTSLISMGLGVFKQGLTGDTANINYSSARFGSLMQENRFNALQRRLIRVVLKRLLKMFLENEVDEQRLKGVNIAEVLYSTTWITPKGKSVDPVKDAQAAIQLIDARLTSRRRVIEEMGLDADAIDAEIAADTVQPAPTNSAAGTPATTTEDITEQPEPVPKE